MMEEEADFHAVAASTVLWHVHQFRIDVPRPNADHMVLGVMQRQIFVWKSGYLAAEQGE
jgi:hypothetical protein